MKALDTIQLSFSVVEIPAEQYHTDQGVLLHLPPRYLIEVTNADGDGAKSTLDKNIAVEYPDTMKWLWRTLLEHLVTQAMMQTYYIGSPELMEWAKDIADTAPLSPTERKVI